MIYRRIGICILIICSLCPAGRSTHDHFQVTPGIEDIYQSVWEMNYAKAYEAAARVKTEDPHNLLVYHVENYIDFVRIFLTDDMQHLDSFRSDVENRLQLIRKGDPASPYYLYSQAEIYIQWSLVRSKNEEVIRAGWDINKAYKLLQKCKQMHPDFFYADKSLSVIHALMGSVKGIKKTMIKLFTSLDGSIEQGISEIELLFSWDQLNPGMWSDEIRTVQSLIQGHIQKNWAAADNTIDDLSDARRNSPLGKYLRASTAYHAGYNDKTIDILKEGGARKHTFYYLDLMAGTALLNKGDSSASVYIQRYLDNHHGLNFLKSACHKMAWYELVINDDDEGYNHWMTSCLKIGIDKTGEDQEAQLAALSAEKPDRHLLLSRLLFDGGYYTKAWIEIQRYEPFANSEIDRIEYTYRKGRILQKLGKTNEALTLLGQTVTHGRNKRAYFACNAALQMAYIYFENQDFKNAKHYAQLSLDIKPGERKQSLHNEAKILMDRSTLPD